MPPRAANELNDHDTSPSREASGDTLARADQSASGVEKQHIRGDALALAEEGSGRFIRHGTGICVHAEVSVGTWPGPGVACRRHCARQAVSPVTEQISS